MDKLPPPCLHTIQRMVSESPKPKAHSVPGEELLVQRNDSICVGQGTAHAAASKLEHSRGAGIRVAPAQQKSEAVRTLSRGRHSPKLGGGLAGTKGQQTSHGGARRPALPSTATGNARTRRQAGRDRAHSAWPLCGTPPPLRTWGLSPGRWGWDPWATSQGVRNPARGKRAVRLAPPALTSRGVPPGPAP